MPELPEVKAHAERLSETFGGEVLARFTPLSVSALKTFDPPAEAAVGLKLVHLTTRGKFLLVHFQSTGDDPADDPDRAEPSGAPSTKVAPSGARPPVTFVVHLMQAGRLIPDEKQSARPRNGIARWSFTNGKALLLTEAGREHKAGVWVMSDDPLTQPPLDRLGVDADLASVEQLREALSEGNQRLHGFLRDQSGLAGIGRMLANEICHRAKLSPFAMTSRLTEADVEALHSAIGECIEAALTNERQRDSMSRSKDRPATVHHRSGEFCPACGDTIRAVTYSAYEVDYCPTCQTGGKVLADNTTSKFLK